MEAWLSRKADKRQGWACLWSGCQVNHSQEEEPHTVETPTTKVLSIGTWGSFTRGFNKDIPDVPDGAEDAEKRPRREAARRTDRQRKALMENELL